MPDEQQTADRRTYVVTGHCAYLDTSVSGQRQRTLFYRGQVVPGDVPDGQIRHNIEGGLIAPLGGDETGGTDAAGAAMAGDQRPEGVPGEPGELYLEANATTELKGAQQLPVQKTAPDPDPTPEQATDDRRKAAQAALAKLGGRAPDGRASKDVLVEYLVTRGGRYEDLSKAEKPELLDMARNRQS